MAEKRENSMLPWVIIGGIILAWILGRLLSGNSSANTSSIFGAYQPNQRGTFGTDTGLYGATVAGGVDSTVIAG